MNDNNDNMICPVTAKIADCSVMENSRKLEFRYKRILRHSFEEIYVFDKNLNFKEVSEGALKNLGYTWAEMKEMTLIDVKTELTVEDLVDLVKPLLVEGSQNILNCQTRNQRKDGSFYDVEARIQYMGDADPVFIAMVTDVTERNRYEEELKALAFRDPGTDLYNKRFFLEQLSVSIDHSNRRHAPVGLILLDMDDFSIVNNTYGHLVGDTIINEFAKKINQVFSRKSDIVARYGGDEFVVLCNDADEICLLTKCRELRELFNKPFMHEGVEITQTASIGICFKTEVTSAEDLIKGADCAMYKAKDAGKNTVGSCNQCDRTNS